MEAALTGSSPVSDPGEGEDEDFDLDAEDSEDEDEDEVDGEDADDDDDDDEDARAVAAARAPRRKKPMGRPKQRTITKTLEEIPNAEIRALYSQHSEVILGIKRQTPTGSWVQIRNGIRCPPSALFDLQEPVTALAGGGTFVYDVMSVTTKELLVQRWKEHYDGSPVVTPGELTLVYNEEAGKLQLFNRSAGGVATHGGYDGNPSHAPIPSVQAYLAGGGPVTAPGYAPGVPVGPQVSGRDQLYRSALASGPQPQYQAGRLMPPPVGLVPQWMTSFPAETQWTHVFEDRVRKLEEQQRSPGQASELGHLWINHEIRQGGDLKAQNAALTQALSTIEQRTLERIETIRRESEAALLAERERRERAEREIEQTRADARYNELKASLEAQRNAKPAFDMSAIVGLATAFAPVLSARSSAEAATRQAEQASQVQLMQAMLARKEPGALDALIGLAPLLTPVLTKWMESSGPQAQAELMGLEHEQRLMHLKMMADMLAAISPEPPPAWQPIVEHLIKAFGGSMLGRALPGVPQPRQLPPQQGGQVVDASPQIDAGLGALIARFAENDVDAAADVRSIYERLPAHLGFHTHEWATILFNVHCRLDAHELAEVVVAHLANCARFGNVPGPLEGVFEQPEDALRVVFSPLPIAQKDPAYTEQIIEVIGAAVREATEDDGEELVTPAPAGKVLNNGLVAAS